MQGSTKEKMIIMVANPSQMVFPHNEAVANATHKKRKRKSSSSTFGAKKNKGAATTTTTSTSGPNNVSNSVSNRYVFFATSLQLITPLVT
jgi:hypothetical protein